MATLGKTLKIELNILNYLAVLIEQGCISTLLILNHVKPKCRIKMLQSLEPK